VRTTAYVCICRMGDSRRVIRANGRLCLSSERHRHLSPQRANRKSGILGTDGHRKEIRVGAIRTSFCSAHRNNYFINKTGASDDATIASQHFCFADGIKKQKHNIFVLTTTPSTNINKQKQSKTLPVSQHDGNHTRIGKHNSNTRRRNTKCTASCPAKRWLAPRRSQTSTYVIVRHAHAQSGVNQRFRETEYCRQISQP
jgi:hypothetical protein